MADTGTIPREILEAAARWYVQLQDDSSEQTRINWEHWLEADNQHQRAWAKMQALERQLASLPANLALPTLDKASTTKTLATRRRAMNLLGLLLATGSLGILGAQVAPELRLARADHRTATGERTHITLADGGRLDINTDSAVDVIFTNHVRQLRLWRGEILVQTATDPAQRPFEVHTDHGVIRALGTRFSVRVENNTTRIAVLDDAVAIRNFSGKTLQLDAGQQVNFSAQDIPMPTNVSAGEGVWTEGKLVAIEQRLDVFLAELERHRPGRIRCAPEVAGLLLSGAFRLGDTDAVLENLAASLPIKLRYFTRYWVMVESA